MTEFEYYVDADKIWVMRTPKGSTCGNDQQVVALCATGEAGGMKVALQISAMLNAAALRAPEAADAGAVAEIVDDMVAAWCDVLADSDEEDRPRQHEDAFRSDCARLVKAASPTAAGIAAPPAETPSGLAAIYADRETLAFVYEEICEALGVTNNEDALAEIDRLKAAPPAASADAVKGVVAGVLRDLQEQADFASRRQAKEFGRRCQQGDRSGERWHARHEAFLEAKLRLEHALTAPVAGADAGMRERAAQLAESYHGVDEGDMPRDVVAGIRIAKAIRALPLSQCPNTGGRNL